MEKLKTMILVGALCFLGTTSHAQLVSVRVNIPAPPPPPRVQVARTQAPNPDYVWHEGRWAWDDYVRDYVWYAGYWEYAPPHRCETPPPSRRSKHDKGRGNGRWRDKDRD